MPPSFWHKVLGSWGAKKSNASTTWGDADIQDLKPGLLWHSIFHEGHFYFFTAPTLHSKRQKYGMGNLSLMGRFPTTQTNINYVPVPTPPTLLPCSRVKQCSVPSSSTEAVWVTTLRQEFCLLDSGAQQLLLAAVAQDTGSELWGMIQTPLCAQGFLIPTLGSSHSIMGLLPSWSETLNYFFKWYQIVHFSFHTGDQAPQDYTFWHQANGF